MRLRFVALAVALALLAGPVFAVGANHFGGQVTVPNAAAATLKSLLNYTGTKNAKQLSIRIVPGSANTIYCGSSGVTTVPANAWIAINSTTPSFTWAPGGGATINPESIYCIVTTGDTVAYVDGVE